MVKENYYVEMMDRPWEEYVKPFKRDRLAERIRITTACRDCDALPRVPEAGRCMVDEDGNAVQVMHNGLRVLYGRYYGSWLNEIVSQLDGVHEPQEEHVFNEMLRHMPRGGTMIEAGAYWGYYSMWYAKAVPDPRVFLVEPHPRQLKVAERNFGLNGLTGDFTIGYFGSYPEQKKVIQEKRVGELRCYSVPEFMQEKGLERVTLLHSDIQGHEEEMLGSARGLLAERRIDWLFVSTHGRRHAPCRDILREAGYRIIAEHGVSQAAAADGLLVAQNPELPEIAPIEISMVEGLVQAYE